MALEGGGARAPGAPPASTAYADPFKISVCNIERLGKGLGTRLHYVLYSVMGHLCTAITKGFYCIQSYDYWTC